MTEKADIFSDVQLKAETEVEKVEKNVVPSEVIATNNNPYDTLNEDQKIVLKDISQSLNNLEEQDVINEFNKAFVDNSLRRFPHDKKFTLAKAMMKSVLEEKSKIEKFTIMPMGKSLMYSKKTNMVISTLTAMIAYEKNEKLVKKKVAIKGFDRNASEKKYQSLHKCNQFYTYEALLIKKTNKGVDDFSLTDYTDFEIGTPPEGKMADMTDIELYKTLGIVPYDNHKLAGNTKSGADGYADSTDLKAVYVIANKPRIYNAPKDYPDVDSISSYAIDFEGNEITLYFSAFPEIKAIVENIPQDEKLTGLAIGTIYENPDTGAFSMSIYNFIAFDDEE